MKRLFIFGTILFTGLQLSAQVGIGTDEPQAMLEVNGTVLVQDETTLRAPLKLEYIDSAEYTLTEFTGNEIVLVADLDNQDIVKKVSLSTLSNAIMTELNLETSYNQPNPTVYAAKKSSGVNLINLGVIIPSFTFRPINFLQSDRTIGSSALFANSDNSYVIPSDGIYEIYFSFKLGSGVEASVLSDNRGIGIMRTRGSNDVIIERKGFLALGAIASVILSDAQISTIQTLQEGDRIRFGVVGGSVLDLGLLSGSIGSFHIKKIAGLPE